MQETKNAKKLSFWQKIKLKFYLAFKGVFPEDCLFGAIDMVSVKQAEKFRYKIAAFSKENLLPLFEKRNADKLKVMCSYPYICHSIKMFLEQMGDDDAIRAYLSEVDTDTISVEWAEKYFINHNADDFFKPYLEGHSEWLPNEVVELLIKREQEVLLLYYINLFKEDDCHNIDQALLFSSSMETAKYAFAEKFLDDSGCKDTINYILKYGDDALIEKLLNKYALSSDEEYKLLFETGNPKFIDLAIEKKQSSYASDTFWSYILEKGSKEQILKCIDKFSLDEPDEYQLVCSQNNEAILHYLKKVKKPLQSVVVENYLFKHGNQEVLDFYRKNICLPYVEERALFKEGSSEAICEYIKREGDKLSETNAVLLIKTCHSDDVLRTLIKECNFTALTEVALLRRNIPEITNLYLSELIKKQKKFSQPAEKEFIKVGESLLILEYLATFNYALCDEAKYALLLRGDIPLLIKFCKESSINEDITIKFVKEASFELLAEYFKNNIALPPLGEVTLINRNQVGLTSAYISMMGDISEEAEVELIRLKDFKLLKEYLTTSNGLNPAAEKEFLHVANDDLFCFYIENNPLFDESEVELIKSGNRVWLESYVEKYDLSESAAYELAKVY